MSQWHQESSVRSTESKNQPASEDHIEIDKEVLIIYSQLYVSLRLRRRLSKMKCKAERRNFFRKRTCDPKGGYRNVEGV